MEPFFSRVWVQSDEIKSAVLHTISKESDVANTLLGATNKDWDTYKHLYSTSNFDDIFKVGRPDVYNIGGH
jgi:hypothetical protein